jgi:hypothetical protein
VLFGTLDLGRFMTIKQWEKLVIASAVFGVSYWVLSQPTCRQVCKQFFQPLESEAGKTMASLVLASLLG